MHYLVTELTPPKGFGGLNRRTPPLRLFLVFRLFPKQNISTFILSVRNLIMGKSILVFFTILFFLGCIGESEETSEKPFLFDSKTLDSGDGSPPLNYGGESTSYYDPFLENIAHSIEDLNCTYLEETDCINAPHCTPFYAKCDSIEMGDDGVMKCIGENRYFECLPLKSYVKKSNDDPLSDYNTNLGGYGDVSDESGIQDLGYWIPAENDWNTLNPFEGEKYG